MSTNNAINGPYSSTPTANFISKWDANSNMSGNNFLSGYTTTATAAATTTLTVASTYQQYFTGSTTQTVVLPVTSTLVLGQSFYIVNNSSGVVTVQSSGGNTIQAMAANTALLVTCILTSGTSAASWSSTYIIASGLSLPLSVANGGTGVTASDPVIQRVSTETGAQSSGTTLIPYDDTIPQNTEGDQYFSLAITPKNSSNILVIDLIGFFANSLGATGVLVTAALFQDSTANALAAGSGNNASSFQPFMFRHIMTAGTTSSTTFKIRAGGSSASTTAINGSSGARFLGGVYASSLTITEYAS